MSQDPKRFNLFSPQEVEKLRLDVRAAVQFLASQKNVDPERIGVLAIGVGATYAALEASANPAIQALVLISGESGSLSPEALDSIQRRSDLPVLCIAQKARRESVREMAQAYALSKNPNSDMVVGLGYGAPMVSFTPGLMEQVTEWLAHNVKGLGKSTPVTFRSSDGWTLYGTLRIPEGASEGSKAPGVVFVHGAKHDQATYLVLERMGVKRGMATLSFAWRGKGKTALLKENEGKEIYGIDILPQTHAYTKGSIIGDAHLDVKAAIEFLASQKSVDSSRIALVGGTSGAGAATVASIGDSRIKAIVTLSAYPQPDEFKQHLSTHDVALLAVVGADDYGGTVESAKELTEISKSKYSRLIMYETAPHGAEMLVVKPDLEPTIVRWLVERLGLAPQKKLGAEFRLSPPGGLFAANWR
ncbi:MAG: dienelactone hydrolase family protein [Acidobacteria bacterium]|nr:dienelactone hydrolase family protein [Acidobacteriota bacterium]